MSIAKKNFVTAVILAGGVGTRMGADITKQRMTICGETVLHRCVRAFEESDVIDAIVVVCREEERNFATDETRGFKKVIFVVNGGNTRAESARLGFANIPSETDFVAIHDAARCLVTQDMIEKVVTAAFHSGAASAAKKITDSIKRVDADGFVLESVSRVDLYAAQTPQVFRVEDYALGLRNCSIDVSVTDDNMVVERVGVKVLCVECGAENIKITTPDDVAYAEFLIRRRCGDV